MENNRRKTDPLFNIFGSTLKKAGDFYISRRTDRYGPAAGKRLPVVLNAAEQQALLEAPDQGTLIGLRNYALLTLLLNLGLRASEALALKVEQVDWASGQLMVVRGKGDRDRSLWLADEDRATLQRWLTVRPKPSPYIFTTLKGRPLGDRQVRIFVKRYAKRKGISKDVHPHTLRHTFATDLLRATGNIVLVQKALGHASIVTTTIYTHIVDDQLEKALKSFRK